MQKQTLRSERSEAGFNPGVSILSSFLCVYRLKSQVRFSSAQVTLSAVSDHAVRFSSAQMTLSAMSNYFATLWTAALQVSPSIIHSQSLLTILMPFESMVLSNRIIFCHLLSPPTFSPSQHQGLFQLVRSLHQVAKVLECQCQHHFLQ